MLEKFLPRARTLELAWLAAAVLAAGWLALSARSAPAAETADDGYFDETRAKTLFAFDDVSIPLTQNLKLEMRSPARHPANPVVARGGPGSPDSWAVQFYGSVIRDQGKFRMWYAAVGDERFESGVPRSAPWRVAYAESDDGVYWVKPNLGLVEYGGSRDNNLVLMSPHLGTLNLKVLLDADDPDPERRYKMGAHVWFPKNETRRHGTLAPYVSRDGLTWKLLADARSVEAELHPDDLVLPAIHFEPVGGLYKWDGLFHASGQNCIAAARPYHGRVVRKYVSPDFLNWSQASAVAFVRAPQHDLLGPGRSREGEQTHEGVSVWNRGNVLLGVGGLWHGAAEWNDVTIDLNLLVSNDGLQFREPLHGFTFLQRGDDGQWDQGGLLQAQGFENVGQQTFVYYGTWDPRNWENSPPRGGVGIAVLPRDRFGDLVVDETVKGAGEYQMPTIVSELITAAVDLPGDEPHRLYVNADGLGEQATLKVELLGANTVPLPEYSGEYAAVVRQSGFQTPIVFDGRRALEGLPDRVRVKVTFEGEKNTSIRFSAIYVQ